jgi:hypothetical protein
MMSNVRSSDTGYAGGLFGSAVPAYAQAGGVPEDMVYIRKTMRRIISCSVEIVAYLF